MSAASAGDDGHCHSRRQRDVDNLSLHPYLSHAVYTASFCDPQTLYVARKLTLFAGGGDGDGRQCHESVPSGGDDRRSKLI